LISLGADVLVRDNNNYLPFHLHLAVYKEDVEVMEQLLSAGISVDNNEVEAGISPLHIAAAYGKIDMAKLLIQKGADVSIRAKDGLQPIHAAVGSYGSLEMIDYLLESGASIDAEDHGGRTPIFYAVMDYNMESISHLAEKGANVNHQDNTGMTPAHYAVQDKWDAIEMLTILSDFSLVANVKDDSGMTPEDYAASEEIKEFLKTLY